jgi:N-acetylmuramoyl-L-alanine amidase
VIGAKLIALFAAAAFAGSHAPAPQAARPAKPLAGKVVGIDPGHNGGNFSDPSFINHLVWNGREREACDTTGTETNASYTEARFNIDVALYLRPCIDRRAQILNRAGADVAIDIHADGGPASGRGVAILTPVPDGPNDKVIASSRRFGRILLHRYTALTGIPISNYDGAGGFSPRGDLAGLNLTTVPKVLIECVNMRNAADAARLVKPAFQRLAAKSMAEAITGFLKTRR